MSETIADIYERIDGLNAYMLDVLKYERARAEFSVKKGDSNSIVFFDEYTCLKGIYRKREEGLDVLFDDAWEWAYNQPSPEKRELNAWIKKLSGTLEELGEGHSDIVRDLYRKLFDLRETASNHLLEYQEKQP